ncbi:MAG: hypothetical protein M3N82_08265 [Pseudomonadota bacterium]|nr:hypothetical protein [Pseudomonadota bacterium]
MSRFPRLSFAVVTVALTSSIRADPLPDPTDFMASMTAFAETCAARFPEMSDMLALLASSMEPEDRKLYDDTRRSPGFDAAMDKARVQFAGMPSEKLGEACKIMHDGLKKS